MDSAGTVLQLLFAGIGTGSIYALVAVGFNVIFKSTDAINFSQGEWVMMGGMVAAATVTATASPVWLACLFAVLVVTAVGLASERLVVFPIAKPTPLLITLISIGLAICTKSAVMLVLGKNPAGYPGFAGDAAVSVAGASIHSQTLSIIAITIAFMVLAHLFFEKTLLGKALRAAAADRDAAELAGIRVRSTVMWSFGIAAMAGAVAGAIITPLTFTSYDHGTMLGFKGFSAAMLGGLGNLYGSLLGGLLLGLLEAFASGYISSHFKDAVAFVVLLVILFWRPSGLIGTPVVEKV